MLKELRGLPELEIELPEFKPPPGMDIDVQAYNWAIESMQPTVDELIGQLYGTFGGVKQLQSDVRFDFEGGRTKVNPKQTAEPGLWNLLTDFNF